MSAPGMPPPWFVIPVALAATALLVGLLFLLAWWLA